MSVQLSPTIGYHARRDGKSFAVKSLDLGPVAESVSPVLLFDDFHVLGHPFPPHPHAGFSAITFVFEDSAGALRSRDTLGHDLMVTPGGICWGQSGRGMMHHEMSADPARELHGVQLFVNLSAKNKLNPPDVLWLNGAEVPEWRNTTRDRVRVVVGTYEGVVSPLSPVDPFTLLDVDLREEITFSLPEGHNALAYVRDGSVTVGAENADRALIGGQAVALSGRGRVSFRSLEPGRLLILSGAALHDPVVAEGPFVMNDVRQIQDAMARFRAGEMGRLAPLAGE